jgi:hypothetical protein
VIDKKSNREKLAAKILFWGVAVPTIFTFFLRTFFIFFNFVYGYLIVQIVGKDYANPVAVIALIASLSFTIGVIAWIHKQYKKHILTTF